MGKVAIAGWGLLIGSLGQALLFGDVLEKVPHWLIFAPLFAPWLLVYVISFCRAAPCGPSRFAQILILAMAWYSLNTLVCELVWLLVPQMRSHHYGAVIPHVLCYVSTVSFVVLIRAVRDVRRLELVIPENT